VNDDYFNMLEERERERERDDALARQQPQLFKIGKKEKRKNSQLSINQLDVKQDVSLSTQFLSY